MRTTLHPHPDDDTNDHTDDEMDDTSTPAPHPPRRRWLRWVALGAVAVAVAAAGLFVWYVFIRDVEDEFSRDDVTERLDASGGTSAVAGDGRWTIADGSELGYRVQEVLFGVDTEAVGRTGEIDGSLTIDGSTVTEAAFEVDVASIESDDSRRDNQFRGRIMSTGDFPTADFTLTEPIELGTDPVEGAEVDVEATGELTLRGTTNTVTFELSGELRNGRIGVLGSIPITFADFGIANPSFSGITTEDHGLLEFVLVFEPAG